MTEPISTFADRVADNFRLQIDAQPEDQLKAPVGDLLSAFGRQVNLEVNWRTEVHADDVRGRPDLGISIDQLLVGHIELKAPGINVRPEDFPGRSHNSQQWKRFKELPNLIYTNGSEWSLYRTGKRIARVRIADDLREGGSRSLDEAQLPKFLNLLNDFLHWKPVVPATAQGLAAFLAPLTRILRDEVAEALARGTADEQNPLRRLANEWRGLLFPESEDVQFADAYAQTLTYGLLLAKFEGAESLQPAQATAALQMEHGLLAEAIRLLEVRSVREELIMPIELLERAINAVDQEAIQSREEDPWLYFYEQFLSEYDPQLRKKRGVYYTPVEVVRAQTRLAGELLRERFSKPLAFADDEVVVLDPAVGTGTYPLAILGHAEQSVYDRLGPGAVRDKLRDFAQRLNGFEVLVGPYSVAHLRIAQRLRSLGITNVPPRIFLTDTLESPNSLPDFTASILQERLTDEHRRAQEIKKDSRVFVCIGNPPYRRYSSDDDEGQYKGGWVVRGDEGPDNTPIFEDFLAPVREAGAGVDLKPIYNDYVYFWRWALWKVFDSTQDAGIVTFITASSYLRGRGFAGMRRKMREVFDYLWIIDLEGDNRGTRKTDNVFAITIPVAIAIGVRDGEPRPDIPAIVFKTKLTGSEQDKLNILNGVHSFSDLEWYECSSDWEAQFYSIGTGAYFDWPVLDQVFPLQYTGVALYRTWPVGESKEVLEQRWSGLINSSKSDRRNLFKESRDRKVDRRYPLLLGGDNRLPAISELDSSTATPPITPYAFRSFDRQYVIADSRVGDFMRPDIWRTHGPRQAYLTTLSTHWLSEGPAATATALIPDQHHFRGSYGDKAIIPLWRNAEATQPNVTEGLLKKLADEYGSHVSPERFFAYAYGVLAQPTYVEHFWDELELPPLRLPITKDADLFHKMATHGAVLLYLHTFGERFANPKDDGYIPQGKARCIKEVSNYREGFTFDAETQTLVVEDGAFGPVTPEVWNYSVSGFQVVRAWLDRRKKQRSGRKSSLLDNIRPTRWAFTEELLELLWLVEATVALQPEGQVLLDRICESQTFSHTELPVPVESERRSPVTQDTNQATFEGLVED